jgi:hypothetical protein
MYLLIPKNPYTLIILIDIDQLIITLTFSSGIYNPSIE